MEKKTDSSGIENNNKLNQASDNATALETIKLDETDQQILHHLRRDGRMAYRALAKALNLTESTIRSRIRRLEEADAMRIVAVTDFEAIGYGMMLAIGIRVEGRSVDDVAEDLAVFREVFSVCQVVGSLDIELLAVVEDPAALNRLVTERLAKVEGVKNVLPAIAMDVLKNQPNWVPFRDSRGYGTEQQLPELADAVNFSVSRPRLDELGRNILEWLCRDARTSNRQIANELGVTEGTVRARIKRMEDDGQLKITAINNINRLKHASIAYIWIEVSKASQQQAVAKQLASTPEIGFVASTLGRANILAITMVQNNAQLADFLRKRISVIDAVQRSECSLGVRFVKHDYRMSRIVKL